MMEHELGSIVKYCYEKHPVTVYDERIPQGFEKPSMYFPIPRVFDGLLTSSVFTKSYMLAIKVFDDTSRKAFTKSELIADSIRKSRFVIPMFDEAGLSLQRVLKIDRINSSELDEGVVQLNFEWESRYNIDLPTYQKIMNVYIKQS